MHLSSRRGRARWLFLFALAGAGAAQGQPVSWEGRAGLASGWLVRGVLLTSSNAPVLQAGAELYAGGGWSAGAAAYAMRDLRDEPTRAASAHAGTSWALSARWRAFAGVQRVAFQRGSTLQGWSGWQASAGLADGDDFAITWNDDRTEQPLFDDHSLDLALRRPLVGGLSLVGGLGRVWGRAHRPYAYGQLGVQGWLGPLQWQLLRCEAESPVRRFYGDRAGGRWVAAAQVVF